MINPSLNTIKFTLNTRAISVNKLWRGGRRFKSSDYIDFERKIIYQLPKNERIEGEVEVYYRFHLKKNYSRSDVSNLIKGLEDVMVKCDLIDDDSMVKRLTAEKFKADSDMIEVEIISYDKNNERKTL